MHSRRGEIACDSEGGLMGEDCQCWGAVRRFPFSITMEKEEHLAQRDRLSLLKPLLLDQPSLPDFHSKIYYPLFLATGFPDGSLDIESACNAVDTGDVGLILGLGSFSRGGKWQPTPLFLPGKLHRQRSLSGYSPKGHEESDTTEQLSTHSCFLTTRLKLYH